jgi:asparagine synthase (glutamine-hydrolysing)
VPLARWFRGPLKQRVRDAVLGERGWPPPAGSTGVSASTWWTRTSRARDYSAPLWTLLMFEAFLRGWTAERPACIGSLFRCSFFLPTSGVAGNWGH